MTSSGELAGRSMELILLRRQFSCRLMATALLRLLWVVYSCFRVVIGLPGEMPTEGKMPIEGKMLTEGKVLLEGNLLTEGKPPRKYRTPAQFFFW